MLTTAELRRPHRLDTRSQVRDHASVRAGRLPYRSKDQAPLFRVQQDEKAPSLVYVDSCNNSGDSFTIRKYATKT